MQTNRLIAALASAAVLIGAANAAASAQTATTPPAQASTSPMTTPTKAPADVMTPAGMATPGTAGGTTGVIGTLALDSRNLRARRTATGYTLSGQALVSDACQLAQFGPSLLTIFPPQYNLVQSRDPLKKALLCAPHPTWITAVARRVQSTYPPRFITVRTQRSTKRVAIR